MTVTCSLALLVSLAALLLLPPEVAGACSSPPPGAASLSRGPARTKSRGTNTRSGTWTVPDRLENRAVPTAFTWPIRAPTTRLLTPDAEGALPCCGRKARSRAGGAPGRLGSWSPRTAVGWPVRPPPAGLSIPDARGGSCGATGTIGSLRVGGTVGPAGGGWAAVGTPFLAAGVGAVGGAGGP